MARQRVLRIPPPLFFAPPTSHRVSIAPRISRRLLKALVRLDDRTIPIAEIYRRLGAEADRLRLPRPSYQRIRVLLHQARRIRRRPSTAHVLIDVCVRARPPIALVDHLSGVGVPQLPP